MILWFRAHNMAPNMVHTNHLEHSNLYKRIFQPLGPSRPHFLNFLESGATFPRWLTSSDKFHIEQPAVVCQSCRGLAPINHTVGSSKQRYGEAYGLVSSSTAALLPPKSLRITVPTTKTASGLMVPPSSASSTSGKVPPKTDVKYCFKIWNATRNVS